MSSFIPRLRHSSGMVHFSDGYSAGLTVTNTNTWYKAGGTTMEMGLVDFTDGGAILTYTGLLTQIFRITSTVTIETDTNAVTITTSYLKNGNTIIMGSRSLAKLTNIVDVVCITNNGLVELAQGDRVELALKADKACVVNILNISVTIRS